VFVLVKPPVSVPVGMPVSVLVKPPVFVLVKPPVSVPVGMPVFVLVLVNEPVSVLVGGTKPPVPMLPPLAI
jgi:hypothetical protein